MRRHILYRKYGKRALGIILSGLGLLLLWPVMLIIAIIIKCDSRGTILFTQKRLGRNHVHFTIYKFRTMEMNSYQKDKRYAYEGDPRITRVGTFLRKTSLDELPQLFNILKGDMCFIGPRPLLVEAYDQYKDQILFHKRLKVTPGLFCLVDVSHRAAASKELQFKLDSEYIDHISFLKDLYIFYKIIIVVIKQKNIYNSQT